MRSIFLKPHIKTENQLDNFKYMERCTKWSYTIRTDMGDDEEDPSKTLRTLLGN